MIVISPLSNNPNVSLDLRPPQADVLVARSALDEAVAAIEQAGAPGEPVAVSSGIKLDPRLARILDSYVQGAEVGEDRATARLRIEAAIAQGGNAKLSLKGLGLLRIPPVIPNVFSLDLSDNRLSEVTQLPCGIQFLVLAGNRIKLLRTPLPARLVVLDVSRNNLTSLPEPLPERLVRLDVQDNGLSQLPRKPPRELRIVNAGQNRHDLAQEVTRVLLTAASQRVYDVVTGGPGLMAAHARKKLDERTCAANLDAYAARIPPVRVRG
ncbi:hypothetical protein [Bordetella sp. H567]|uniref:hypothetical protein n=1 Tax=Bordetella sp. H567 TaxID=1697043 RepID=UPI00082D58CB|nr:hypothetical protein [Bordetella sp. H567]